MKRILFSLLVTLKIISSISLVYAYDDFIDLDNSLHLYQRDAGIAECGQHLPLITTGGFGPCLFIVLYDKEKKLGIAAHWDDETKREDIERFFTIFEDAKSNFSNIEAYLVGGWDHDEYPYPKIIAEYLENALLAKNITVINKDHLFEKQALLDISLLDNQNFPQHAFYGAGFDVCSGALKLTDTAPVKGVKKQDTIDYCTENPLREDIPYSGCSLQFLSPKKVKIDL